jgi:hypothetical protein
VIVNHVRLYSTPGTADLRGGMKGNTMTAVIAFPKKQQETIEGNKQFGPAHVIIFTGVRHERLQDVNMEVSQPRRRNACLPSRQSQATAEDLE